MIMFVIRNLYNYGPKTVGEDKGWDSVRPLQPLLGTLRKKGYLRWYARNADCDVMYDRADSSVTGCFTSCFHHTLKLFHVPVC